MIKLLRQSRYKAHRSAEKFIHRRQHKKTRRRRRKEEEKKKRRRRRWGKQAGSVAAAQRLRPSTVVVLRVGHFARRTLSASICEGFCAFLRGIDVVPAAKAERRAVVVEIY